MAAATSSSLALRGLVGVPSWCPVLLMLLDSDSLAPYPGKSKREE